MRVKTIKDYKDRITKIIYRVTDESLIREVKEKRGKELIEKGVVEEIVEEKIEQKPTKDLDGNGNKQ